MPLAVPPAPPAGIQACISRAHARYDTPEFLLRAILAVEGGGAGIVSPNANGTADLGWAQINSTWLPTLKRVGITRASLLYDPCVNVGVSAWILRNNYMQYGNWFQAIEAYNAGNRLELGSGYATRVVAIWTQLWRTRPVAASGPSDRAGRATSAGRTRMDPGLLADSSGYDFRP